MEKWLFDIIGDGTLKDNQKYLVVDKVFSQFNQAKKIKLKYKGKNIRSKNHIKTWNSLKDISYSINQQLLKTDRRAPILIRDKEYEHNSNDPFLMISSKNADNFSLSTGNIIGHVKRDGYELKITSRFGDNFLKEIIADSDGFIELDRDGGQGLASDYEWLLIYLWSIKLRKAYRLGVPKAYQSHREKLSKVKGNLEPLDYYMHRKQGKYWCNFREYTYNISAVRLIFTAIEKVFKDINLYPFIRDLNSIRQSFITATNGEVLKPYEYTKVKYFNNSYYTEYNTVIDLSKKILRNDGLSFGKDSDTSAFIFDVSMLFEYFIRKIFIRHGYILRDKYEQEKTIETCNLNQYRRKLKPDLIVEAKDGLIILDVKYKHYDFVYGVKREDLFQLHTYIGQYGNIDKIKHAGFIYPVTEDEWKSPSKLNYKHSITNEINIMNQTIPFTVFFFVVPSSTKEIKEYVNNFQQAISEFITEIKNSI